MRETQKASDERPLRGLTPKTNVALRRDVMSAEKRSALMARIRGRDTKPERQVAAILRRLGVRWQGHCRDIPGRPDFVMRRRRIAIYVDGDFWHGWRFPVWRAKLSPFWRKKIAANRRCDRLNHARARRQGWTVVRIWEHQLDRDIPLVSARLAAVIRAKGRSQGPGISSERH
jgi:DNA mismatch endonuclease (patch repair protein)